jgi:hypothetical protein
MSEREIFANYELDDSSWKKFMFSLLCGSLVLHTIILLSTIYVPSIRDAFYVAMLFSDAPTGWEKRAYQKTEIEEATVINLPDGPLYYPAGYFELANGEAPAPEYASMVTPYTPVVINSENSFPPLAFDRPKPLPTLPPLPRATNSTVGALPKLPKLPKPKKGAKLEELKVTNETEAPKTEATPTQTPKEEVAEAKASPTPHNSNEIKLNKQPWFDLGADVDKKIKSKQLDLSKSVAVTIEGELDKDGKFIGSPKLLNKSKDSDPEMAAIAQSIVAALNDSEMLRYIKDLSDGTTKRRVVFDLTKDKDQVAVQITSDIGDQARANKISSGLNAAFALAMITRADKEETALLKGASVGAEKNQVVIKWMMSTEKAMPLLMKKLTEVPVKQPQTNSTVNTNVQAATN